MNHPKHLDAFCRYGLLSIAGCNLQNVHNSFISWSQPCIGARSPTTTSIFTGYLHKIPNYQLSGISYIKRVDLIGYALLTKRNLRRIIGLASTVYDRYLRKWHYRHDSISKMCSLEELFIKDRI